MRRIFGFGAAAVLTTALVATTPAPAGAQPLPGTVCGLFPADSIFNADISSLPVSSMSAAWKGNMSQQAYLHPDLGTFAQWYGMPVNIAPPPTSGVTPTFLYDTETDHPAEGYPIDANTMIEGGPGAPSGSDRHALVVDKNRCKLYELYNLQNFTNGATPQAGSGAVWDLSSDAMRPDGWTSADAAGLPMTPLLLRPDEILAGQIAHAIRFTAHCTHSYIWPGSHDAGLCATGFPPMGARFRLRSTYNISTFSAQTQVVLHAFQHYGLILADNGSDWYFQGTTDDWWGTAAGAVVVSELKSIPAAQFDAVDESGLQAAVGSYQAASYAWSSLGGSLTSGGGPSACAAGNLMVFALGGDGVPWYKHWNGSAWSGWTLVGGNVMGNPASVCEASTTTSHLLTEGLDHALYHRVWNGSAFGPWDNLGGSLTSGPGASSCAAGKFDVFVLGGDGVVWRKSWNGSAWSGWILVGGNVKGNPAVVCEPGTNVIDLFVEGTDARLYHRQWTGSAWLGWENLGGSLSSSPAVASCAAGKLDVFVNGGDGVLWRKTWNGTAWSGWIRVGGNWTSDPGAVCEPGTSTIDLFARGADRALWSRTVSG